MAAGTGHVEILPGQRVAVQRPCFLEDELRTLGKLVRDYGAYALTTEGAVLKPGMGMGEGIPSTSAEAVAQEGGSFVRHRVPNNDGTELIFPPRVDISILSDELRAKYGDIYGRPALAEVEQPTFRGLYTVIDKHGSVRKAEGDASEDLVARAQEVQTRRFTPIAQELFGTPVVVPKMLFANVLLPGQEISMHTDVPEFRGIHPRTCPNWLQCVMHGSGLFARWRILQAAALTYYQDMAEGSLAIYCGPNGEGTVVPASRGLAVLVEAETCPHHSDVFPPKRRRARLPTWPRGVRLRYVTDQTAWLAIAPDGAELVRFAPDEVRVTTQMKLHCFKDRAEERAYLDHTDDLRVQDAIEMLTEDLRRRGWFEGAAPPRSDLAVMMVKEYIRWPTPEVVAACWSSRPDSVFARAATGLPRAALSESAAARPAKL